MKKYDLHVHTHYSPCSTNGLNQILKQAKKKDLSGIAITDHNTINGALELKRLNKDPDFEIIIAEEINTDIGHVLAYYLKKEIKPGKFSHVLKEIRKQNALCALAHPYNYHHPLKYISAFIGKILGSKTSRPSLSVNPETLQLMKGGVIKGLDAVEGFNSRNMMQKENKDAHALARKLNVAITAGSDAHFLKEIGNAFVEFDDRLTLKEAILNKKLRIRGKRTSLVMVKVRVFLKLLQKSLARICY